MSETNRRLGDSMVPEFDAVIRAVMFERIHQIDKHGLGGHSIGAWLLIMEAELAEAKQAAIKPADGRDNVISEIIQVIATGFACLEQYGVKPIQGRQV